MLAVSGSRELVRAQKNCLPQAHSEPVLAVALPACMAPGHFSLLSAWEMRPARMLWLPGAPLVTTHLVLKTITVSLKSGPWTGSKDSSKDQTPSGVILNEVILQGGSLGISGGWGPPEFRYELKARQGCKERMPNPAFSRHFVCVSVHMCADMWKPEGDLGCCSSSFHLTL